MCNRKRTLESRFPLPSRLRRAGEGARAAFTLIELLAVLVVVALLLATFIPYAMSLRETSNRTRCAANLANINRALRDYAAGNGYMYPRVRFDATRGNTWTAFTGPDDANPFAADSSVAPNDVTASLWLLVREGLAQPGWFVCPSGDGSADRVLDASGAPTVVKKRGNFRSRDQLNYGYATPFSSVGEYRLNDTLPARFALLADQAPSDADLIAAGPIRFDASTRALQAINSPNHRGEGQNVLYADGTVRFETSPYCGVRKSKPSTDINTNPDQAADGDHIYTALAAAPLVDTQPPANDPGVVGQQYGPAYRYDSLVVPAAGWTPIVLHTEEPVTPATPSISSPLTPVKPMTPVTPVTTSPATTPTTQP